MNTKEVKNEVKASLDRLEWLIECMEKDENANKEELRDLNGSLSSLLSAFVSVSDRYRNELIAKEKESQARKMLKRLDDKAIAELKQV